MQWVGKTPAELWLEIEEIIVAAVEEEREACAKICDAEANRQDKESGPAAYDVPARNCAVDIRARSTASDR